MLVRIARATAPACVLNGGRHEATRVDHHARRCSGDRGFATRGARAATYAHAGSWRAVAWDSEKELSNPFYHWVVQGFEDVGLKPGL